MNRRVLSAVAISSTSFLIGFHFSDILSPYDFLRRGRSDSVVVPSRLPLDLELGADSKTAHTEVWKQPSRASQILQFGFPGYDNLRTYSDFIVSYNRQTRNAHWVQEHLTSECLEYDASIDRSKSKFTPGN